MIVLRKFVREQLKAVNESIELNLYKELAKYGIEFDELEGVYKTIDNSDPNSSPLVNPSFKPKKVPPYELLRTLHLIRRDALAKL